MLEKLKPERLLFSAAPELPATPKKRESPLATAVAVPDENVQLAPVPHVSSVLPTQVSLSCAKAAGTNARSARPAAIDAFLKRTLAPARRRRWRAVKREFKELCVR